MKKTKVIYWIFTGLFLALMLFSGVLDIICGPEAIKFMSDLGYPVYIIRFLGVAKTLGVIAILIPGYPRIKEWAYAGLVFDLCGATYSMVSHEGFQAGHIMMLVFIGIAALSYIYYHKLQSAKAK